MPLKVEKILVFSNITSGYEASDPRFSYEVDQVISKSKHSEM